MRHFFSGRRGKPRVLLLADRRGWAYDICARMLSRHLSNRFDFDIRYVADKPIIDFSNYDLLYVYFWGETYHLRFPLSGIRILKEVSSHRWEDDPLYGPCTPTEFVSRYLSEANAVICTSRRLYEILRPVRHEIHHAPNGYDESLFTNYRRRTGEMTVGWAGNVADPVKRFADIVEPATQEFAFSAAKGSVPHRRMNRFYNSIDVFLVTSRHEGTPLPLLEAMAAGCFPVTTDVGICPEIITSGENGIIFNSTPDELHNALVWCRCNIAKVRSAGIANSVRIADRNWKNASQRFADIFQYVLNR